VASGGFSTHDASFGFWDSPLLEGIACVLMLVAATNFGMHWYAWRARDARRTTRPIRNCARCC
jgi:trk system potassium uptake protein TrkH